MADAPYQSLYRRYRPQRFGEVRGQEHVTVALRNAVRDERVTHGYLFSGPRGTGKTSSARILAKALNCAAPTEGEPCGGCESCVAVHQGTSFDVHELDAASNNGVDAMRDLISRASLGTPGRWKVYIVDEVHMLSAAASNTLLKTLEEPPAHVIFVLATTEPHKVLPTIRSRVQHFEFRLLAVDDLAGLVDAVAADAGLGLDADVLERVVRRGAGSARDTLSALDQAAAFGGMEAETPVSDEVIEAACDRDTARALVALAEAISAGRDPRRLGEEILGHLRDAFLAARAPGLVQRPADEVKRVADQAGRLGAAAMVRAMELVGDAMREMKDAIDPRVSLEVAVVRMTAVDADSSPAALLERIERLERRVATGGGGPAVGQAASTDAAPVAVQATPAAAAPAPAAADAARPERAAKPSSQAGSSAAAPAQSARTGPPPIPPRPGRSPKSAPPASSPAAEGEPADATPAESASDPVVPAASAEAPAPAPTGSASPPASTSAAAPSGGGSGAALPDIDTLTTAWDGSVLHGLRPRSRALFGAGRFVEIRDGAAVFALPNQAHRRNCETSRDDVEAALAVHFGQPVPLRLIAEDDPQAGGDSGNRGPTAPSSSPASVADDLPDDVSAADVAEMEDAPPPVASHAERLKKAFPGAEEIDS